MWDILQAFVPAIGGFLLLALGADAIIRVGTRALSGRRAALGLATSLALMTVGSVFPEVALIGQTHSLQQKIDRGEIYVPPDHNPPNNPVSFSERSTDSGGGAKYQITNPSQDNLRAWLTTRVQWSIPLGLIFGSCLVNLLLVIGAAGLRFGEPIPTTSPALLRDGAFLVMGVAYALAVIVHPDFLSEVAGQRLAWIGLALASLYVLIVMATDQASASSVSAQAGSGEAATPPAEAPASAAKEALPNVPAGVPPYLYFLGGLAALWFGASLVMQFVAEHLIWIESLSEVDVSKFASGDPQYGHDVFAWGAIFLLGIGVALPELIAALLVARSKEPDLALDTILSATVLNLLGGLGLVVLIFGGEAVAEKHAAFAQYGFAMDWVALAAAVVLALALLLSGRKLRTGESLLLIFAYGAYLALRLGTSLPAQAAEWLQKIAT